MADATDAMVASPLYLYGEPQDQQVDDQVVQVPDQQDQVDQVGQYQHVQQEQVDQNNNVEWNGVDAFGLRPTGFFFRGAYYIIPQDQDQDQQERVEHQQEQVNQDQQNNQVEQACIVCGWTDANPMPQQDPRVFNVWFAYQYRDRISELELCEHREIEVLGDLEKLENLRCTHCDGFELWIPEEKRLEIEQRFADDHKGLISAYAEAAAENYNKNYDKDRYASVGFYDGGHDRLNRA